MKIEGVTIMVEKEELMITPTSKNPKKRPARFLTPSLSSPDAAFELPLSAFRYSQYPNPNIFIGGWTNPLKNWAEWVNRMRVLHESTWRQAGIHDAIINSTYTIFPRKELVLGLSERWCSLTSSFVFPFGEASITLEDVAVLGGFSVSGDCVSTAHIGDDCDPQVIRELEKARDDLNKSKSKKATVVAWMRVFMGSGSCAEHVAFLVLWLSRHVFRFAQDVVGKHLHTLAACLAKGTRVALAPAVLASLYQDLTLLKRAIVTKKTVTKKVLKLWSPMHLVQIWAWERFPTLRPQPNSTVENVELRMARWNKVSTKGSDLANMRSAIESASESFVWRPYVVFEDERCWQLRNLYPDKEKWVSVGPGMREDFKTFAKIVRVSELVGIACIQPYFPHRLSMQFGFDQDIPGRVVRFDETADIAWKNYDRPIRDWRLYIPARSFRSGVTGRYMEWWKQSKLVEKNEKGAVAKAKDHKKRKTITELLRETHIPTSPRTKKQKAIVVKDADTHNKKSKEEKCVPNIKEAAKANKSRKRKRNGKQRLETTDRDKVPHDCMSALGGELPKETDKNKQRLERSDGNKSPDNSRRSSCAELQKDMWNDKQKIEEIDGNEITVNCGSSSCTESPKEVEYDDHGLQRIDKNEYSYRFSDLACNGADVHAEYTMETQEVVENLIHTCNETGNEITEGDRLSHTHSPPLVCDGNDVHMESLMEPTQDCENTITRHHEAEIAVEGRVIIAADSGDSVNNNKRGTSTSLNRLRMLKTMPLEARISRLEILVARLKAERMGAKAVVT